MVLYFGCADHAFFFGEVARAKGIPVVFVKTLDADFLREMIATNGGEGTSSWRYTGGGSWKLLDASANLPEPLAAIAARAQGGSGRLDRTLDDGTHVVVIYAADEASLLRQLDQLVVP